MLNVSLIAYTPEPEKVVAAAAKLCYSNAHIDDLLSGLTPEKSREFVERLAKLGHESPTEHVSFTFGIEGVSRSLLAQITRHRIASYSVQSQRYVRLDQFDYVTPPEIAADPAALEEFQAAMAQENENYKRIAALLKDGHIRRLMAQGMSETEKLKHQPLKNLRVSFGKYSNCILKNCRFMQFFPVNAYAILVEKIIFVK